MPLHSMIADFLKNMPAPAPGPLNPGLMREGEEQQASALENRVPVYSVQDRVLQTEAGAVKIRLYIPDAAEAHGVLVYFHGGAFFLGSLNTHDHVAREIALATRCRVVAVDYRLAPENAFPAGLNDCYAAVKWVVTKGADPVEGIGWDGEILAVAGDSSGGNYAAVVSGMALDEGQSGITHQVLYYPSLDLDFDTERYASLKSNAVGYGLETAMLAPFNAFYINSGANPACSLASPIKRQNLVGLPPALIVTAEYDPLRDEGELYGKKLAEAGVTVKIHRYEGAGHGFVQHFSWLPEFRGVYDETAQFLRGAQ
ncbi:alpha/beta hydrolase [Klebsiella quasivariicola]|uniref:alpha/beta hydrolase n=1 Tax=Klebsiella quasivariicola TaxID=2026240 RepID=UPI001CCA689B|nr:alpha/beta hydrolase [Klebsiella quasivariicola]MBZ9580102.1 alpha/beta hydrolase [Klebsiella quasivariicola]